MFIIVMNNKIYLINIKNYENNQLKISNHYY